MPFSASDLFDDELWDITREVEEIVDNPGRGLSSAL